MTTAFRFTCGTTARRKRRADASSGDLLRVPARSTLADGPVAQRLEQRTFNPSVQGSNPCGPTIPHREGSMSTDELLSTDERDEVTRVIRSASPESRRSELEAIYVEARVAGLCREGAIELLRDAIGR